MAHVLVIGYNSKQYQQNNFEPDTWLTLDLVKTKRVTAGSTVANHPIQTGDTISDHMYRNATTETVSGTFGILSGERNIKLSDSVNGNVYKFGSNKKDRLTDVEETFEEIKNMGYLCKLISMETDKSFNESDSSSFRFKIREHMVLKDITWEEMENTVNFDFGFQEAIVVNSKETYDSSIETMSNLSLPNVGALTGTSLAKAIQGDYDFGKMVITLLYAGGYISDQLMTDLAYDRTKADTYLFLTKATGVVGATGGIVLGILTAAGFSSAIPGPGWIATGVLLAVAAVLGIIATVKSAEAEALTKKISTLSQLDDLYERINYKFMQMKSNCTVYSFPENKECEAPIKVGSNYYVIKAFKKNVNVVGDVTFTNVDGKVERQVHRYDFWDFSVRKSNNGDIYVRNNIIDVITRGKVEEEQEVVVHVPTGWVSTGYDAGYIDWAHDVKTRKTVVVNEPPTNLGNLNFYKNGWFCDDTGEYQVFLVNLNADDSVSPTLTEKNKAFSDLTNYKVLVCKGDIQTEVDRIKNVVFDALSEIGTGE